MFPVPDIDFSSSDERKCLSQPCQEVEGVSIRPLSSPQGPRTDLLAEIQSPEVIVLLGGSFLHPLPQRLFYSHLGLCINSCPGLPRLDFHTHTV